MTYVQFDRAFKLITKEFGLEEYTLGCLRAGRATALYEQCRDMERVRHLLRHDHLLSTDRYIQEVQACLPATRLSVAQKRFVVLVANQCPLLLTRLLKNLK